MNARDMTLRANRSLWSNHVELAAFTTFPKEMQVASILWEPADPMAEVKPFVRIMPEQAQVLMDDLWRAGIRPTEAAGSAGAMRAAERHIQDLRQVAFKVLGITQ